MKSHLQVLKMQQLFQFLLICVYLRSILCSMAGVDKKAELKEYKYPPCQSCKLLVSSFKNGIMRTKRGKLEGGDTNWEEKNKLSYARSEIRFVEIMENICVEMDRGLVQCQGLAEENEALFEEHWKRNQNADHLESWLCTENLKVCCPDGHYGESCKPCTGFPNVCSSNGKCKGAGTRKGNGQCSCNVGYEGDICDRCARSYYESYKDDNKLLCSPCHQSCELTCTQAGPKGCLACRPGWTRDVDKGCLDVNECLTNKNACPTSQFCVNNEGSYTCLNCDKSCAQCDGDGPDMCLECADGFYLKDNICEDSKKQQKDQALNVTRYLTYIGLCVATCIVFQRNTVAASAIGLAVALYISVAEYTLNSSKNSSQMNFNMASIFPFA